MAGLPGSSAWVGLKPPLSASGPISGSVLGRSPDAFRPHDPSVSRLFPRLTIGPEQFPPALAMMVLDRLVWAKLVTPPKAGHPPSLSAMVLVEIWTCPA